MLNGKKILLVTIIFFFSCMPSAFALENLFYMLRDDSPDKINDTRTDVISLKNNYKNISILVTQAYQLDHSGLLRGGVNSRIINFTAQNKIKLMPMITNADFSEKVIHQFLHDPKAQARAILAVLNACQTNHYYGVQFDLEGIDIDDRDELSTFYQAAGDTLHKNGFAMSATVVPRLTTDPSISDFQRLRYENWSGVYDYKALAQSCDFITLMAYDQHGDGTPPGPVASQPWVEDIIKYAVSQIPPQKISLGIPVYSDFWYAAGDEKGVDVRVHVDQIGFDEVTDLLKKNNATLFWSDSEKVPYTFYERDWLNQFIFAENAASFTEKYALAKKYNLRGIAVWRIGMEDPGIWGVIQQQESLMRLIHNKNNIHRKKIQAHL